MRKRGLCCRPVSIRLSRWFIVSTVHTAEDIAKLLSRPGSAIILVFFTSSIDTQFQGEPLQWGQNTRCGENLRFSTEITVCLGNGTRDRPMVAMER